ncbi:MAG: DUF2017 family protein [Acidimicrobiia bacterium]|nr:DUF2017 family protein [Acidimicrobiia bacterium]
MSTPFTRKGAEVRVRLDADARAVLAALPDLLGGSDDAGGRLSYRAHPGDEEAEARYRDLVGDSLDDLRGEDRSTLLRSVGEGTIGLEEAEAWMRVIGEARLVLAARLGIEHDGWETEADPGQSPEMALLGYLGYLQDGLVGALGP